ncbi:UNVERIFIED_CONTAM: class A beta-lactamase [Comamonas sp. A-3]|uniref:Beta-lactamase n=2 Tax=Comamonadaceae TaxID=80864 RepID=A0AA42Q1U0_9BURK|nr:MULTISPECIES: class A beta-lactamase [Comamonas]ACY32826.1 beta-lactamase [Comamonas thiooxydans]MDH1254607.1 class A beta-lactamase [Comamonas thiooxydans]MDH1334619.1 class A beta-lactamase [Comamonas thiooxydans]MDH1740936.1 class A beta-lactamase [Comamonas thiooxydans]MDH1787129.1 class A beta-lactamase [Comamonas thiooxydans]
MLTTGLALGLGAWGLSGCAFISKQQAAAARTLSDELAALEIQAQGRFGLYVLDTVSGAEAGWRGDERFPMCSTFKTLLAARMLYLAQRDEIRLWRKLYYSPSEVVAWSPISEKRAGANGGMTVQELCEAMVLVSDNTAANVLLEASGGPAALTQWLRELGDGITRLDRNEPSLNTALPGDERDTTTPQAMVQSLQKLLLGDVLEGYARALLQQWLVDSRTGDKRVRAGMPGDWTVGGKTGSGERGTACDTLIVWPTAQSAPLLVTAYLTGSPLDGAGREAVLARAGEAIKRWYYTI